MAIMKALNPAPQSACPPGRLIATEAGRSATGSCPVHSKATVPGGFL